MKKMKICLLMPLFFALAGCLPSPEISCTVTYDGNGCDGGTVPVDTKDYERGDVVSVAEPGTLSRTEHTFIGWNTSRDRSGTSRAPGSTFKIGWSDVILYAEWRNDTLEPLSYRDMIPVPGGTFLQEDTGSKSYTHTVSRFYIAKYETTYDLWYTVCQWAIVHNYNFANGGTEGNDGFDGEAPTGSQYEPVARINWRDCIVWCNAYSEMTGYTAVYRSDNGNIIKDSRDSNSVECDGTAFWWTANGYRLPTEGEWQYAASYLDGIEWTQYDYASGAYTFYNDTADINPENSFPDGKDANDYVAVYSYYWNGSWQTTGVSSTEKVYTKTANQLGIHNMSGNVFEWCWDWMGSYPKVPATDYRGMESGEYRAIRGGGWGSSAEFLRIGHRHGLHPYIEDNYTGFRLARKSD
jgi:formylglycine-generating enzyme required for sulfatase activity